MRLALVYDRVNKFGGAERVLLALHEIWPEAPLFTAVYHKEKAPWAKVFEVRSSFLQMVPFAKSHHEVYPWLTPLAFESFNFDNYDVVISLTSAEAKGIITKPKTLHICYCLTPTRYLFSGYHHYLDNPPFGIMNPLAKILMRPLLAKLRLWDFLASQRPDIYLAISDNVAMRIKKYYRRASQVIYPPVDLGKFKIKPRQGKEESFFLTVSRLVSYKRVDIVIRVFNELGWPLKIIGDGLEKNYLKSIAGSNISFLEQNLTDRELLGYYQNCQALVFAGEEDFGLVSLEAQACGKPVIAYNGGGIPETIIPKVTGELFYPQTKEALIMKLKTFDNSKYDGEECRKNALKYDITVFKKKFKEFVKEQWKNYQEKTIFT